MLSNSRYDLKCIVSTSVASQRLTTNAFRTGFTEIHLVFDLTTSNVVVLKKYGYGSSVSMRTKTRTRSGHEQGE